MLAGADCGDVVTLAADADDQPVVSEGGQGVRCRPVRDAVLLGQAQDGGHPAGERAGCDLLPQELGQLMVQRHRQVGIEHKIRANFPRERT